MKRRLEVPFIPFLSERSVLGKILSPKINNEKLFNINANI